MPRSLAEHSAIRGSGRLWCFLLVGLVLLASGIRFYRLGSVDTRSDEVQLWRDLRTHQSVGAYFRFHFEHFKIDRVMPLPRIAAAAVVHSLGVAPNFFWIRVPYALCGILCVWAFFRFGTALYDRRLGLVLAAFAAVNPYCIYWSRVAHVYAFMLCFMTVSVAFVLGLIRSLLSDKPPGRLDAVGAIVATILASYSHLAPWPLCFSLWSVYIGLAIFWRREGEGKAHLFWSLLGGGIWALTLLPWGMIFLSSLFLPEDPYAQYAPQNTLAELRYILDTMLWGSGFPGVLFSYALPLLGVAAIALKRWRLASAMTILFGLVSFVSIYVMLSFTTGSHTVRYYSPLWTVLIALSGIGVCAWTDVFSNTKWKQIAATITIVLCVLVCGSAARPVCWLMTMPGPSYPYSRINHWMDANLSKGTPVIVDRWFEPWNEMQACQPSNVIVTFTIPNEPQELMLKYNWPQTVKDFFHKYPDAAYLELCKKSPIEGQTWNWPRQYFRRHIVFTNEEMIALGKLDLMPSPGAGKSGPVVQELFYNTREDAVELARSAGQQTLVCYGPEWGYVKLWQQYRDFRDWRILEDKAALDVYNLMPQTNTVSLLIRGMAANGGKRVRFGMLGQADFQNLQLAEWRIERVPLKPGLNQFVLSDVLWSVAKIPLLVDRVDIVETGRQIATGKACE